MRGAVLAGGAASRYGGRPKGLMEVGGRRILDRVVDAVAAAWRRDLHTIPDARPGCGSLGGIYTAVTAAPGPVLAVAWDMPFVTLELLRALVEGSAGWDVFLPESDGRRGVEPLCGVYGPACGPAIKRQIAAGDLQAIGFHPHVRAGRLGLERVREFGDPAELFFNVNAPDDLVRAEAVWRRRG